MTEPKDIKPEDKTEVTTDQNIAISVVFRGVPKAKRILLENMAKEFTKKHRKLVNYIEK